MGHNRGYKFYMLIDIFLSFEHFLIKDDCQIRYINTQNPNVMQIVFDWGYVIK